MSTLTRLLRRRLRRHPHDAGMSNAVELVILAPAILLFLGLLLYAGRLHVATSTTQAAAHEAARAASIARAPGHAQAQARQVATQALSSQGLTCTSTTVHVDASDFALPAGTTGAVTVTVDCTVPLSDISLPGIPGQQTITADAVSVIDTYRERP